MQSQIDVHNFFIIFFFREAVDFRFSSPVSERMSVRRSTTRSPRATVWVPVRSRSDIRVKILLKRKWAASNHFMRFNFYKKIYFISFPSTRPRPRFFAPRTLRICSRNSQNGQQKCGRGGRGVSGGNSAPPSTWYFSFAFFGRFSVFCEIVLPVGIEPTSKP